MSSVAGKAGLPFSAAYTGSKHALHGYFESLRSDLNNSQVENKMSCTLVFLLSLLKILEQRSWEPVSMCACSVLVLLFQTFFR